jgi:hypothetical protein
MAKLDRNGTTMDGHSSAISNVVARVELLPVRLLKDNRSPLFDDSLAIESQS